MKLACLIRNKPHCIHLVNQLNPDLVIVEKRSAVQKIQTLLKNGGIGSILKIACAQVLQKQDTQSIYQSIFGDDWKELNSANIVYVEDINNSIVTDKLIKNEIDCLIDHGTSLLKPSVLNTAKYAINLHWGLSPYYRGTHCTEWAIINSDLNNVGVTIHLLSTKIDGGDIITQKRINIDKKDTISSINARLTKEGTQLLRHIIQLLKEGKPIITHKQNMALGKLYLKREYKAKHKKTLTDKLNSLKSNPDLLKTVDPLPITESI